MVEIRQSVLGVGYEATRSSPGPLAVDVRRFPETDVLRGPVRDRPIRPDFHVVGVIDAGKGLHTIDFRKYALSAGTVFWLRPGQVHRVVDGSGLGGVLVLFASAALAPGTPAAGFAQDALRPSQWSFDPGDALVATALRHLELLLAVDYSSHDGRDALRLALAPLIAPVVGGEVGAAARPAVFERFAGAVEAEYSRRHHVREYEAIVHADARTIDRAVRGSRGVGAKRYLDERIVLQARRRLATSDIGVAALARELGFTEATNFVKFFRRMTGTTPNAVRYPARLAGCG